MDTSKPDHTCIIYWTEEQCEKYCCFVCRYIIFPPMQLTCCGKRLCEACATSKLNEQKCPHCSEEGQPEVKPDRGFQRELNKLQVNCPRCNDRWSGTFPQLQAHLPKHQDLLCPDCDEKYVFPQQVEQHRQENCKNRKVTCILSFIGCSEPIPFNEMDKHYFSVEHQTCLLSFVVSHNPTLSKGNALQKSTSEPEQRILQEYLEEMKALIEQVDGIYGRCLELASEKQVKETKVNELRAQSNKIKESINNNTTLTENIFQLLVGMNTILDEIKCKPLAGHTLLPPDGIFIWRMDFSALRNHGQPVQCEPFLTSQSGYKLAVRAEIFKDRSNDKQFLSLAFLILRGEFDAILSWPVLFPITISVIDLSARKKDISYEIPTESRTLSFHRPVNDTNQPFTIEKFFPIENLLKEDNGYVQNDSLFVKVHIDFLPVKTS